MKCHHCGEEIPDSAKVCGYCGTKQEEKTAKFCGECGTEVPIEARVCGNCGTPFEAAPKAKAAKKAKPAKAAKPAKTAAKTKAKKKEEPAPEPPVAEETKPVKKTAKAAKPAEPTPEEPPAEVEKAPGALATWWANRQAKRAEKAAQAPMEETVAQEEPARAAKSAAPAKKAKPARPRRKRRVGLVLFACLIALVLLFLFVAVPLVSVPFVLGQTFNTYERYGGFYFDEYDAERFDQEAALVGGGRILVDSREGNDWSSFEIKNFMRGEDGRAMLVKFRLKELESGYVESFVGPYVGEFETSNFREFGVIKRVDNGYPSTQAFGFVGPSTFNFNMEPYWDLQPGKWHYALFSFTSPYAVHVKLWQAGNPLRYQEVLLQFPGTSTPRVWNFLAFVNAGDGVVELDKVEVYNFSTLNTFVRQYRMVVAR